MSEEGRLTEERLRTWLDGNQTARERLCVQILSLDRRFSAVRPRQPKGGPDGGFDLEAEFDGGTRAVGAIGFRNSPDDQAADQRWVRTKFEQDLARAIEKAGAFAVFVFLTNVRLTVDQRNYLLESGRSKAAIKIEVFDRERLRLLLDSPSGLAARYQFLQISLSEAEQAAFFSRWGSDLESLVTTSFAVTESRLQRLEFLHEKERPLSRLAFRIELSAPTRVADLPHVRAFLSMHKLTSDTNRAEWHVGVCNNSPARNAPNCGAGPCLASAFWLEDRERIHGTAASTWKDPLINVYAGGGFSEASDPSVLAKLSDIDGSFFAFFMNRQLFDRIGAIYLYGNEYLLWQATGSQLRADAPNEEPGTPWVFSPEELADPWVRVMPEGFVGEIRFSEQTPRRMWDASRVDDPGKT